MVSHGVKGRQLISTEIATEKDKVVGQRQLDYAATMLLHLCVTLEESEKKKPENMAENFCKKLVEQKATQNNIRNKDYRDNF